MEQDYSALVKWVVVCAASFDVVETVVYRPIL